MTDTTALEAAAATILQRAVTLDKNGRFTEALVCYQEGLQILVDSIKGININNVIVKLFNAVDKNIHIF